MSATRYELVARIGKVRGLEGKVTVYEAGGLPLCLHEGLSCHVVPPALYGPRQLTVQHIDELGDGTVVVQFEGIDKIDAAEELVGRYLLADIEDLDIDLTEVPDFWLDRTVVDESYGELGTIVEFIETPANEVWVVQGPHGEVLVPAVEEFVLEVPEDISLPIRTRIPQGLV